MFRINLLPAEFGDAIWIEYGTAGTAHRILIDCGTSAVFPRFASASLACRNTIGISNFSSSRTSTWITSAAHSISCASASSSVSASARSGSTATCI